jgi:hypothetical protein
MNVEGVMQVEKVKLSVLWIVESVWEKRSCAVINSVSRFPNPRTATTSIDVLFVRSERCESKSTIIAADLLSEQSSAGRRRSEKPKKWQGRSRKGIQTNFTVMTTAGKQRQ